MSEQIGSQMQRERATDEDKLNRLALRICHAVEKRSDDCDLEMHARVKSAIRGYDMTQDEYNELARSTPREACSPLSAPRGEQWTVVGDAVKTSSGTFIDYASTERAAKAIADAHNAALAAIKSNRDYWIGEAKARGNDRDKYQQQLAAERQIKSAEKQILLDEVAKNHELNKQLAAERQKTKQAQELLDSEMKRMEKAVAAEQEANRGLYIESSERYQQLAAEREKVKIAEENANKWFDEAEGNNNCYEQCVSTIRKIEQQLLHAQAAIAEKNELLREVLADEESGEGWGPDVTTVGKLRKALEITVDLSTPDTEKPYCIVSLQDAKVKRKPRNSE